MYTIDGANLEETYSTLMKWDETFALDARFDYPVLRDEGLAGTPQIRGRVVQLSLRVVGSTREDLRDNLTTLAARCLVRSGQLKQFDDRYLTVYLADIREQILPGGLAADMRVRFQAVDPFWYSVTEENDSQLAVLTGQQLVINNEGNVLLYPYLKIKAATATDLTNVQFKNVTTSKTLTVNTTVTSADYLVVKMFERTAAIGSSSKLKNTSGDWWTLAVGNNTIQVDWDGGGTADWYIYWRERWL